MLPAGEGTTGRGSTGQVQLLFTSKIASPAALNKSPKSMAPVLLSDALHQHRRVGAPVRAHAPTEVCAFHRPMMSPRLPLPNQLAITLTTLGQPVACSRPAGRQVGHGKAVGGQWVGRVCSRWGTGRVEVQRGRHA